MDNPEAPPKSAWRLPAVVLGCILLAAAPAILTAFDEAIDSSLHLSDLWPEFWTLLAQIEAWWIGGVVLGAAFIGSRALVNRLRQRARTALYLTAAAVWWLLAAVAPLVLTTAIVDLRINQRLGNPDIGSAVEVLLTAFAELWLVYAILILAFVGAASFERNQGSFGISSAQPYAGCCWPSRPPFC